MSSSKSAMGNESSRGGWPDTYSEIKKFHDAAYTTIQEAINLDESQIPEQALEKYKEGIALIDKVLRVQVTCPDSPDQSWENACKMIQKMKKTRAEIVMRISNLQPEPANQNEIAQELLDKPPSYDEATSECSSPGPDQNKIELVTYNDLAQALNRLQMDTETQMEAEVVYMYEGVQLYFISPNGDVSSSLQPQTMKIIIVESNDRNVPRGILQIGDWVYPLIPGVSPCYRNATFFNAFILPNVYSETRGSSIAIILPPDTDECVYEVLESILYGIVGQAKPPTELSEKISTGLVSGASYISRGLVTGAEKLGNLLNTNTPKLINRMNSADEPTEIPRGVSKTMKVASSATNKAAKITGFVAEQVGFATLKLGKFLAPHIQKQGSRLLTTGLNMSDREANAKMAGVLTVAAGAVEGFSTIYRGLENSAGILGNSLKDNTVKVVQHKYGQPAGSFTADSLSTFGNVYQISQNAKLIQPKHLAKRAAKDAGKALVSKYAIDQSYMKLSQTNNLNENFANTDATPSTSKDLVSKKDFMKKE